MMKITIGFQTFRIGFKHIVPMETQCSIKVITSDDQGEEVHKLIGAASSFCSEFDNFSRAKEIGRAHV